MPHEPASRFAEVLKPSLRETVFLLIVYAIGLYFRLWPRLEIDAHLLTFNGDIWYRITMAQYILDHWALPDPDIRYLAYGYVPMWYPPVSPVLFAVTSYISGLDIPTVSSRVVPFFEALSPVSIYFLSRYMYNRRVAFVSTAALALTPSFVYWTGISDPQSFTIFMIPLLILAWIWHSKQGASNLRLLALSLLLAVNFLMHLSYFIEILVLFMVTIALVIRKDASKKLFLDLGKVIVISQLITMPWWLSKNLSWWWINALVTSSGLYPVEHQLYSYGIVAAIFGILSYLYIAKGGKKHLVVVLWALPILLETQNEAIIAATGSIELTWHTLAKPLEGFRFYAFAAQPLAIAIGIFISEGVEKFTSRARMKDAKKMQIILLLIFFLAMAAGMKEYDFTTKFQNSGLTVEEYDAALWFRENSLPGDRIIADYYRSQMFAGVSGGKALLGGMFPLRNVDYPYIKAPGRVQNDLFILYNTSDAREAHEIAKKYNSTHIFYSGNMISYGNLLSYYKPARKYGVDIDKRKFENETYFREVYRKGSRYGEVVIVKVV
ncbi:MAG: hypothetical protein ACE5NL_00755 [Candidatus Hydrothermarchaeaceae archaeon]